MEVEVVPQRRDSGPWTTLLWKLHGGGGGAGMSRGHLLEPADQEKW